MCSRCGLRPTEPTGLTATQSRPADLFTTAGVPGRSAALGVCVASSIAAAAPFDRKLAHYRNELGELRQQNIHCRPPVWTADRRPHPAVTRTLQYAADIASSRNGHAAFVGEIPSSLSCAGGHSWLAQISQILQRGWLFAGIIDSPAPLGTCPRP